MITNALQCLCHNKHAVTSEPEPNVRLNKKFHPPSSLLFTKGAPKIDEYVKYILSKYHLCILATHLINRLNLIDSIGKSNGHAASLQAPHGNDYFTNDILLPYLDFRNCPF